MNPSFLRLTAAASVMVVAGIARMPFEQSLTEDLREQGMLSKPLNIETRKKVGQGFWAVSLGGLRTLVATVLNLRAFAFFENQQWTQLSDTYETVVQLAPNTEYYWDTASWHMAYNAAAYYQTASKLPELRRRAEWRQWVEKGTAFLEEGAEQNPDSWYLWSRLGWIYADPNKLVDYEKSAAAYKKSIASGNALPYIRNAAAYAVARIPGRESEALEMIRDLHQDRRGQVPTMNCLLLALEHQADPSIDPYPLALDIFGGDQEAYHQLSSFYLDFSRNFPTSGVPETLKKLEMRLEIPGDKSVFKRRKELEDAPSNPWQQR
ncbi:tetratricopeptide repeat protein [Haloferula sp.]|uniref:tetratricopeptide repeat protein n=1 Tax=Haloferula sp. TaxID=2497595 RepID=UPI0032A0BD1C